MWLTQIEMDLARKRNGIIFFYVCAHVSVCESTSRSQRSPVGVFTDCSRWVWSSPIQLQCLLSKPHQGAREQTQVLRLEQKVLLADLLSQTYFFLEQSKWRCSKETKSRTSKKGKDPKGEIVHTPVFETGSYVAQAVLEHAMLQMIHGITGLRHHV